MNVCTIKINKQINKYSRDMICCLIRNNIVFRKVTYVLLYSLCSIMDSQYVHILLLLIKY